jgi:hypothetical protein
LSEWRHNDGERRWDLVWPDETGQRSTVCARVADGFIACADATAATRVYEALGSVPPPLAGYLPPDLPPTPVVFGPWRLAGELSPDMEAEAPQ